MVPRGLGGRAPPADRIRPSVRAPDVHGLGRTPYPQFDRLLEAAGASNNGSTNNDRTNYFEQGPVSALPLMLWLDADRMGWLLPTMDSAKVDLQRDVVKNERRQSVENQPYGLVEDVLPGVLYPKASYS
jgi:zinc protease